MLHFVACAIAKHYVYSCGQINPQKATHQIDRICGAREYCAVMSALFIGVQGSTPFIDDVEENFGRSSLKTSAIASNVVLVRVREAPCSTVRNSKGQLQQQRVM